MEKNLKSEVPKKFKEAKFGTRPKFGARSNLRPYQVLEYAFQELVQLSVDT